MAVDEVQQRAVYVKVAAVLMVCLVGYGALQLMGIVR
jgi:hypothetical protein